MGFEKRRGSCPAEQEHHCPTPRIFLRWLPFLVWPRYRHGAQWRCGYWGDGRPARSAGHVPYWWVGGCGALWEFIIEYDQEGSVAEWKMIKSAPVNPLKIKGATEPIFKPDGTPNDPPPFPM